MVQLTKNRKRLQIVLLFLGGIFLLCRAPFGYSFNDEPFIITLGQRLSYGDSLIIHEWHLTQVFAPVMMYFYRIFHLFSSSNTGIILTFRYVYCVLWFFTCLTVFLSILRHFELSIWVFLFLVLFAPFDLMSLSYKSFGVMCSLLLPSVILNYGSLRNDLFIVLVSTISCLFTLACPFFGLFYVICLCGILIYNLRGKPIWNNRSILMCLALSFFLALLYLYFFIFRQYNLSKVLDTIPYLLKDPEHALSGKEKMAYIFNTIKNLTVKCKLYTFILLITFSLSLFKNKFHQYKLQVFSVACAGYLFALVSYLGHGLHATFNYEVIDIALLGIIAFTLLDRKPWDIFLTFTLISVIYIISDCLLSSNTGLFEFGMNSVPAGVSGIIYIVDLSQELKISYKKTAICRYISAVCTIILLSQIGVQGFTRMQRQFFDDSPFLLTSRIDVGACKGLITTQSRKDEYTYYYDNLRRLLDSTPVGPGVRFLSLHADPVQYLNAELPFATFSAWTFGYDKNTLPVRLSNYYNNTPQMIPDIIYARQEDDLQYLVNCSINMDDYVECFHAGSYLFVKKAN